MVVALLIVLPIEVSKPLARGWPVCNLLNTSLMMRSPVRSVLPISSAQLVPAFFAFFDSSPISCRSAVARLDKAAIRAVMSAVSPAIGTTVKSPATHFLPYSSASSAVANGVPSRWTYNVSSVTLPRSASTPTLLSRMALLRSRLYVSS